MTLGLGSRSPIFELNLAIIEDYKHVQYESPSWKTSEVIVHVKIKLTLWPWKLGQGHPSSNLILPLWRTITMCNIKALAQKLKCIESKFTKVALWPWEQGQGHPSSKLPLPLWRTIIMWNIKALAEKLIKLLCGNSCVYRQQDRRTDKLIPVYPPKMGLHWVTLTQFPRSQVNLSEFSF